MGREGKLHGAAPTDRDTCPSTGRGRDLEVGALCRRQERDPGQHEGAVAAVRDLLGPGCARSPELSRPEVERVRSRVETSLCGLETHPVQVDRVEGPGTVGD